MLIWGFEKDTKRTEIVDTLEKMFDEIPIQVKDAFTFEKETNFGVIQSWTSEDKRLFKKWLSKNELKHGDAIYRASDNLEREQNRKERSCGKVKKALCEAGTPATDVVVKYRQGIAKIKKDIVADWKASALSLSGRPKEIEPDMNTLLDKFRLRAAA